MRSSKTKWLCLVAMMVASGSVVAGSDNPGSDSYWGSESCKGFSTYTVTIDGTEWTRCDRSSGVHVQGDGTQ